MTLDFQEIRVEDGFARFLDRTTHPAFSKDLSQVTMTIHNPGNRHGERARLAGFNPYAESGIGWVIEQGELEYSMRFTLDGEALGFIVALAKE